MHARQGLCASSCFACKARPLCMQSLYAILHDGFRQGLLYAWPWARAVLCMACLDGCCAGSLCMQCLCACCCFMHAMLCLDPCAAACLHNNNKQVELDQGPLRHLVRETRRELLATLERNLLVSPRPPPPTPLILYLILVCMHVCLRVCACACERAHSRAAVCARTQQGGTGCL